MTPYNQGDVVLVPFPFTNLQTIKRRPAVIISADWFNKAHRDCVVVAITSKIPPQLSRDNLQLSDIDLQSAGLPKKSIIKTGKIITLEQRLIIKTIGKLPNATLDALLNKATDIFGQFQRPATPTSTQ